MITLQEFYRYLDTLLQCKVFKDYCPNGLQVQGAQEIRSFSTAVSASLETLESAKKLGVQALIVHHGMFWKNDPYEIIGTKREKLKLLLSENISLLAYHLPLDGHPMYGNNWKAAKDLGWTDISSFGPSYGSQIGVKGKFTPRSRMQFKQELEKYYNNVAIYAPGGNEEVRSAALVSGGAYKLLVDAAREGVDCYITGNADEPAWSQAFEEKINFFALGHTATEVVGVQALGEHLAEYFGLEYHFIDTPNPL